MFRDLKLIIFIYLLSALVGLFLLPKIFSPQKLSNLIRKFNIAETKKRDNFFRPLVKMFDGLHVKPNYITASGFIFIGLLAWGFYFEIDWRVILILALGAGLSDLFDGMVARLSRQVTSLGGALDGLRDFLLFLTLNIGLLVWGVLDLDIFLWFTVGAVFIELFKLLEILARRRYFGLAGSFKNRFSGQGKLSIDRAKFFIYTLAVLILLFSKAINLDISIISRTIFIISIVTVFISVLSHVVMLKLVKDLEENII